MASGIRSHGAASVMRYSAHLVMAPRGSRAPGLSEHSTKHKSCASANICCHNGITVRNWNDHTIQPLLAEISRFFRPRISSRDSFPCGPNGCQNPS